METSLAIISAVATPGNPALIHLTFNDGTEFSVYQNDGSPRGYAHELLDAWLEAGNEIALD
jgi:hypothetical protein